MRLTLDWKGVHHLRVSDKLKELLDKHSALFKKELGTLTGTKATLHIKEGSKPRFFKARNIPYVMKKKVEKELQCLQDEGIITPVQFSEWAAPIVPVVKQNGDTRVCGAGPRQHSTLRRGVNLGSSRQGTFHTL